MSALPGIEAAALSDSVPPSGAMVARRYVTQDYFRRLAFPFFAGVPSPPRIANANTYSVVLSNALMRRLFSSEDPLGKHILKGPQGQWFMVVGIAGDVKTLRSPDLAP